MLPVICDRASVVGVALKHYAAIPTCTSLQGDADQNISASQLAPKGWMISPVPFATNGTRVLMLVGMLYFAHCI